MSLRGVESARLSSLHNALEHVEVGGERLPSATRIIDYDGHATAGDQGERHRHPVVIIRVNGYIWLHSTRRRRDHAVVPALLYLQ